MLVGQTNRRTFIAGLGGAAAWPATLVAQVPTRRPLIAYLGVASPEASATMVSAFLQSLRELGYRDGHEFDIAYRFADGDVAILPRVPMLEFTDPGITPDQQRLCCYRLTIGR